VLGNVAMELFTIHRCHSLSANGYAQVTLTVGWPSKRRYAMAGMARVTAPDGSTWTVRRRWYPWRRALGLQAIWHGIPDNKASETSTDSDDSTSPRNPIVRGILVVVGVLIWLVMQAGKAVIIAVVALVVVVLSLADLILQLLVMPFVLLARAFGVMRWPVQIEREKTHFRTEHADGFDAAADLCDDLAARIQSGALAPEPTEPAPTA
jgi:hypothetical protein